MTGLLDLPNEILAAIFAYFAAPVVTAADLLENDILADTATPDIATLVSLSLTNKRLARCAKPYLWRKCTVKIGTRSRSWADSEANLKALRALAKLSTAKRPLLSLRVTLLLRSLSIQWRFSWNKQDANLVAQVIGSCAQLRYLMVETMYSTIPERGYTGLLLDYAPIRNIRQSIAKLHHLVHINIAFTLPRYSKEYCPIEECLAVISGIRLSPVTTGPTVRGLSDVEHAETRQIASSYIRLPGLTAVRFAGTISNADAFVILSKLSEFACIRTLNIARNACYAINGVPPKVISTITSVSMEEETLGIPYTLPTFPLLHTLRCKLDDILLVHHGNPAASTEYRYTELVKLVLADGALRVLDWAREYMTDPNYMPKLQQLDIHILSGEYASAEERALMWAEIRLYRHLIVKEL